MNVCDDVQQRIQVIWINDMRIYYLLYYWIWDPFTVPTTVLILISYDYVSDTDYD